MNLKDLIKKQSGGKPPRLVIHGIHGVGKSYFASKAPDPIFLITEDGLTNIEVDHFPLAESFNIAMTYIDLLIDQGHEYKTFVIDTLDWLEKLIFNQICYDKNVSSIEDIGYGKGYVFSMKYWAQIIEKLNTLRSNGMAIVLLAHNEIKPFSPPDGDSYDRYQIKLHKSAASMIEEWADAVLFAKFREIVTRDKNNNKSKAVGSGERILCSANRPAWRAKSRYDMPDEIPLDFNEFMKCIKKTNNNNTEEN